MDILKRDSRYGAVVVASFAVAIALLFGGPARTADALALSNNVETTISLATNAATGSDTFTTLAPITITCGVVDITAGAADGVAGITLTLGPGWTFLGGAAPAITYAAWPAPDGQATGTIASANSITDDILTSCSPGSVVTFTGVQVKPLSDSSASATIIADINTADVTVATITAQAATPTPTPTPAATAAPTAVPTAAPTAVPTAAPTSVPTAVPTPVTVTAPTPADTGNAGLGDAQRSGMPGAAVGLLVLGAVVLMIAARRVIAARAHR